MKVVRTALLLILIASGSLVFSKPSEAHGYFGFSYSYPGYHHYSPWGYGYGYRSYYFPPSWYYPYSYYTPRPYGSGYYGAGEIRAEVKPDDAKVFVDGYYVGQADNYDGWWQRLRLTPGTHKVTFRAQGYEPYSVAMRIQPGGSYHIKYQMQPGNDSIAEDQMRIPRDSRDNQFGGRDRSYRNEDQDRYRNQDPGDENRDNGYDRDRNQDQDNSNNRDQDGDRDQTYDRNQRNQRNDYDRREDNGNNQTLYLHVEPRDATVYIDGNYFGTADTQGSEDMQVLLPAGSHKIEVVRPGYKSYSQNIGLTAKANNHMDIILETK